jgi:hypothetical protein
MRIETMIRLTRMRGLSLNEIREVKPEFAVRGLVRSPLS